MTEEETEIRRKKRVLEYAEKLGNINTTCRRVGIARSTFYLSRDRYRLRAPIRSQYRHYGTQGIFSDAKRAFELPIRDSMVLLGRKKAL